MYLENVRGVPLVFNLMSNFASYQSPNATSNIDNDACLVDLDALVELLRLGCKSIFKREEVNDTPIVFKKVRKCNI